jgi:tRNA A37 N6-isopentenylltransferase MiaA
MEGYKWKLEGLGKGVDVALVVEELTRLQEVNRILTPEVVVRAAEDNNSILHKLFEWDDNKAAYNWRLQQARTILNNIEVTIITDGEPREIAVFEVTTRSEGYKSVDTFTNEDVDFVRASILRQLNTMKSKLKTYKEFDKVLFYIDKAIEVV